MKGFDYRKFRKALVAALGALVGVAAEVYADNAWVMAAVAAATVLGVYGAENEPA